jgi:homoserine O-acetyltransferase
LFFTRFFFVRKSFLQSKPIEAAAKKMEEHSISALPVVDADQHLIGLITSDAISTLVGRGNS